MSGKESLLTKPLGTSLKRRSVLSLQDHRPCPLSVCVGRGGGSLGCCPYVIDGTNLWGASASEGVWCLQTGKMPIVPSRSLGFEAFAALAFMVPHL